jgi:glucokinase
MNKQQEILRLERLAEDLKDGYCGAWLADQLPFLITAIKNDVYPDNVVLTNAEWRAKREALQEESRREAVKLREGAEAYAVKVKEEAHEHARKHREYAAKILREEADKLYRL